MKITVNVLSHNKGRSVPGQQENIWRLKMMIDYVKERGEVRYKWSSLNHNNVQHFCSRKKSPRDLHLFLQTESTFWISPDYFSFSMKELTNITSQTLVHGGVGAQTGRQFPAVSWSSVLLRALSDRLQAVDSGEVCTWHGCQYSSQYCGEAGRVMIWGVRVRLEYCQCPPGPALLRELSPCPMVTGRASHRQHQPLPSRELINYNYHSETSVRSPLSQYIRRSISLLLAILCTGPPTALYSVLFTVLKKF